MAGMSLGLGSVRVRRVRVKIKIGGSATVVLSRKVGGMEMDIGYPWSDCLFGGLGSSSLL